MAPQKKSILNKCVVWHLSLLTAGGRPVGALAASSRCVYKICCLMKRRMFALLDTHRPKHAHAECVFIIFAGDLSCLRCIQRDLWPKQKNQGASGLAELTFLSYLTESRGGGQIRPGQGAGLSLQTTDLTFIPTPVSQGRRHHCSGRCRPASPCSSELQAQAL